MSLQNWQSIENTLSRFDTMNLNEAELFEAIRKEGLHFTIGGKYHHLMGDHDKGKAVLLLKELFSKRFKQIKTVGVGNQLNNFEMLRSSRYSVFNC